MERSCVEVAIALDCYDDLFSDFDIRCFRERAISRDFLDELRVRMRKAQRRSGFEMVLLVPAQDRVAADEELIAERLRSFFKERSAHYQREDGRSKLRSFLLVGTGLALSLGANLIEGRFDALPLFKDFLLIPAWFFVWNGLDLFLRNRGEIGVKREYYRVLAFARITFADIEGYR